MFLTVGIYKFDAACLKFLYCLYIILHYSQHFFVVSTHWVGYVHIIFKLYTAPYKQTKKDRLLKKAPLEVRHNEGGSFFFECKWVPMSAPHSGSNYWSERLHRCFVRSDRYCLATGASGGWRVCVQTSLENKERSRWS